MNASAPHEGAAGGHDRVGYTGRFAPSPTGALHAGSMVAALASWLDARAHDGRWLVRIEDVDTPRCVPGAEAQILRQLADCGLLPDAPPLRQSERGAHYAAALRALIDADLAYPCACSRSDIEAALVAQGLVLERHAERIYPGTCRPERGGLRRREPRAWRLRTQVREGGAWHDVDIDWADRRLGAQHQPLTQAVGDFVLKRADGLWAYQLAVVVDDAAQGVSDIVRGADLADNTPRQIWLQRCLGLTTPRYLHTPLVRATDGDKLSKQNGAQPVDTRAPLAVLSAAAAVLELPSLRLATVGDWLAAAVEAWRARWT